ncbi:DUF4224 domain-containing protein [Variovorax guangxiensis]|uniref:DUF4224 domain-containing protein n=1 Tax=Variovorax guangxiensis TaxID=1775474 RepID=A0A3S0X6K0_9BURK|nr:DUF4224 domain-containing protein [Variovorax guangxiensis]RUR65871.1 DUF4224 domain-containing protein [Variovorax guangxiensis]
MTLPLFLTDAEIAEICDPLKSPAAQKRFLRAFGMVVNEKPNGKPLVVRSHAEWVLSGRIGPSAGPAAFDPRTQPNVEGLLEHLSKRKLRRPKKED